MKIWDQFTYHLAGEEKTILASMRGMDSPWHSIAAQLLKISPTSTWGNVRVEQNAIAGVIKHLKDRGTGNNIYKYSRVEHPSDGS